MTFKGDKDRVEHMKNEKEGIVISQGAVAFFGVVMLGLVGFSGYLYGKVGTASTPAAQPAPTQQQAAAQPPAATPVTMDQIKALFNDKNLAFGSKDSKVLFVEFSDPSCPFCHVAAGNDGELNKQMGTQFTLAADGGSYVAPVKEMKKLVDQGKAGFVWLYANGHGSGEMGTKAFYCAKEKGKFWEVHDLLMSKAGYDLMNTTIKNDKTKSGELAAFLKGAVDPGFMKSCLDSGKYEERLASDMQIAQQFGFSGTPSFFINTKNFAGAYSYTDMKAEVEAALK